MSSSIDFTIFCIAYGIGCLFAAVAGSGKMIGWIPCLLISIFFTPVIGFLLALADKDRATDDFEKKMLEFFQEHGKEFKRS